MAATREERQELLHLRANTSGNLKNNSHRVPITTSYTTKSPAESSYGGPERRMWIGFSIVGGLIYGYNVSLAASLQYIRDDLDLSSSQEEVISATATLSDAMSMLVGGYLADAFGRKPTAMFACVCSVFGALMASFGSASFAWLVLWRLCTGVGNGLSILLIPMYISESVNAANRGTYLTLFQLGVNSGCAFPYLFMIVVNENWRACLAFGSLPALYILYSFQFIFPESIKWLRWKENPTSYNLEIMEEGDGDDDEEEDTEFGIKKKNGSEKNLSTHQPVPSSPSVADIPTTLNSPRPHLELLIGILLAYVNNCVDASLFYGPEIISKAIAHYTRRDANIFGLICSLVAVGSVLVAAKCLIDTYPRRQLYLLCLTVVCVCFLLSGVIFAKYSTEDFANNVVASTSIMVTFAVLNIFAAIGPSILFVVILSELFQDSSYRARFMSYCTFTMSLISLLVNGTLLTLFETLGTATTFVMYGITYVACLVFFTIYLPETKQRQLV